MFYKFRNLKGKHQITENIYLPIYEWRGGGRKDKRKKKNNLYLVPTMNQTVWGIVICSIDLILITPENRVIIPNLQWRVCGFLFIWVGLNFSY